MIWRGGVPLGVGRVEGVLGDLRKISVQAPEAVHEQRCQEGRAPTQRVRKSTTCRHIKCTVQAGGSGRDLDVELGEHA